MVEPMVVAWSGIHRHNRSGHPLVFHWRVIDVPARQQRQAAVWCRHRGITLHIYDLTGIKLRSQVTNERLTEATALRLVPLQELQEVNGRILYLDSDILVQGSLDPLFEMPLGKYACAAADDPSIGLLERKLGLGLTPDTVYFNAGILLINTKEWMDQKIAERAQQFLYHHPTVCPYEDQDALNATIAGEFQQLDESFNRFSMLEKSTDGWNEGRWSIIHFAARPKPWNGEPILPSHREHRAAYWKAARSGLRPLRATWKSLWTTADVRIRRAASRHTPRFFLPYQERLRFVVSHGYVVTNSSVILMLCWCGRRNSALKWRMAKAWYYEDRLRRLSRLPLGIIWVLMIHLLHKNQIFSECS